MFKGKTGQGTRNALKALGKDLVLLLDGYDELNESGKTKLKALIECNRSGKETMITHACLLVTSRPTNEAEFLDLFDKRYSLGKHPKSQTKQLVLKYFQNNSDQSEEFWYHLDPKLEEVNPLTLFLHCWLNQQEEQDKWSEDGDVIFHCIVLLARQCNVKHNLNLSNEEIVKSLYRLGQLCYTYNYYYVFRKNVLQTILKDPRLIVLAKYMGMLKVFEAKREWVRYDAVHRVFSDSLSGFFYHVALEMRAKCSREENLTFVYDLIASIPNCEFQNCLNVHFSADREPVLTFRCRDKLQIKWTSFEIVLEFLEVLKYGGVLSITYDSLMKSFSMMKILKHSKDSHLSLIPCGRPTWVEKISACFVNTECLEEGKTFLLYLLKRLRLCTLSVRFDDELDHRFGMFLEIIMDFFTKEQMSCVIEFHFPQGVDDESSFLITLSKVLGIIDNTNSLSTQKLREQLASWAKNERFTTRFWGNWANGPMTVCTLKRTLKRNMIGKCSFIFKKESEDV